MDSRERKEHWEKVFQNKDFSQVSWFEARPELSLRLIHESGVSKNAPLIDVGAGTSTLVDCLLAEGYSRPAILDISSEAIRHVRERLGESASRVEFFESDVTEFAPPHCFDLWHDRAVFHFLTDAADRARYTRAVGNALAPGGHLILAAFAVGGPTRCSGLNTEQYDAARFLKELGGGYAVVSEARKAHRTPEGKTQDFDYIHLVRAELT